MSYSGRKKRDELLIAASSPANIAPMPCFYLDYFSEEKYHFQNKNDHYIFLAIIPSTNIKSGQTVLDAYFLIVLTLSYLRNES